MDGAEVMAGVIAIEAELPNWSVTFTRNGWRAAHPNHAQNGLVVEGPGPGEVVARARALARVVEAVSALLGPEASAHLDDAAWPSTRRRLGLLAPLVQEGAAPFATGGPIARTGPIHVESCCPMTPAMREHLASRGAQLDVEVTEHIHVTVVGKPFAPATATVPEGAAGGFKEEACPSCKRKMVVPSGSCGICSNCGTPTGGCSP